jgi:hypothetical protein
MRHVFPFPSVWNAELLINNAEETTDRHIVAQLRQRSAAASAGPAAARACLRCAPGLLRLELRTQPRSGKCARPGETFPDGITRFFPAESGKSVSYNDEESRVAGKDLARPERRRPRRQERAHWTRHGFCRELLEMRTLLRPRTGALRAVADGSRSDAPQRREDHRDRRTEKLCALPASAV